MSKKLTGALVARSLMLLPVGAPAASSHRNPVHAKQHHPAHPARQTSDGGGHIAGPTADVADRRGAPSPTACYGLLYAGTCVRYTYTCVSPLSPKQLAVSTNSDTLEDQLESYRWPCTGAPDR